MKRLLICTGLLAAATTLIAQQGPPASPPQKVAATIGGTPVSISYSSPGVKGREGKIFTKDGLISHNPHYPVWRAGANSATTLEAGGDLQIGNVTVPKGTYTLFVDISDPDNWVLIVNKKTGEWGLAYDSTQDLGKVKMQMATPPGGMVENLKYTITDSGGGKGILTLAWENHSASVPISTH
ncbi:MAG TPA: DUF2911 domain-containing protein [Terracidiphilus sp.]|jgi:hypothetical protein